MSHGSFKTRVDSPPVLPQSGCGDPDQHGGEHDDIHDGGRPTVEVVPEQDRGGEIENGRDCECDRADPASAASSGRGWRTTASRLRMWSATRPRRRP